MPATMSSTRFVAGVVADAQLERLAGEQDGLGRVRVDDLDRGDPDAMPERRDASGSSTPAPSSTGHQGVAERADHVVGLAHRDEAAVVERGGAGAHLADEVGGVGDDDDRAALGLEGGDLVEALALERLVADGEDLVDEQDVGVDVDGDGEAEPDVHARRVELHLVVDHPLDLVAGEVDDVVEAARDRRPASCRGWSRSGRRSPCRSGRAGSRRRARAARRAGPACGSRRSVGRRMPAMHLSSVDLPEPLWPSRPIGLARLDAQVDVAAAPRSPRTGPGRRGGSAPSGW